MCSTLMEMLIVLMLTGLLIASVLSLLNIIQKNQNQRHQNQIKNYEMIDYLNAIQIDFYQSKWITQNTDSLLLFWLSDTSNVLYTFRNNFCTRSTPLQMDTFFVTQNDVVFKRLNQTYLYENVIYEINFKITGINSNVLNIKLHKLYDTATLLKIETHEKLR